MKLENFKLTIIDVGEFILEVDQGWKTGDTKVISSCWIRNLEEVNTMNITVIINIVHDLQQRLTVTRVGVI